MKSRNIIAVAVLAFVALAAALFPEMVPMLNMDSNTLAAGMTGAPLLLGDTEMVKKAIGELETQMKKLAEDVGGFTTRASADIKQHGVIQAETSGKLGEVLEQGKKNAEAISEARARLLALEQAGARKPVEGDDREKSAGRMVIESAEFKALRPHQKHMDPVSVGNAFQRKTAIVNATGLNQPLVPAERLAGIVGPGLQVLTMRDLIPVIGTGSNMIEFCRELSSDIEASPQYSSPDSENVPKKESALTFELANEPVVTVAHWIPASRQVLSDSAMLAGYIDTRLRYGLALTEEDQILNGTGAGGDLNGLVGQAAAYSGATSGDTDIDTLLRAMNQVALSGYVPTAHVLHPTSWTNIRLVKDSTGRYIFGDPQSSAAPQMWGLPVRATQSIAAGSFLTGAFIQGCTLFDREDATVRVAEQHADFFVKNMVAVLAEERLALVVYRGTAFVTGTL
jgi:HK97 family phage major capsid protein